MTSIARLLEDNTMRVSYVLGLVMSLAWTEARAAEVAKESARSADSHPSETAAAASANSDKEMDELERVMQSAYDYQSSQAEPGDTDP